MEQEQNKKNETDKGSYNYWLITWNNPGEDW